MDSKEEILAALEDFGRKPTGKVPPILQDYLRKIAATGETIFPWSNVKPLFVESMDQAMQEFNKRSSDNQTACPNVENVNFDEMRKRLLKGIDFFTGAPFTIQRLCELITNPNKHYVRTDKFLRGIEKNVLVVSTVDPFGRKVVSEPTKMVLNGTDSNGSSPPRESKAMSHLAKVTVDSPFVPPAPSNSPVATSLWPDRVTSSLSDSPSQFTSGISLHASTQAESSPPHNTVASSSIAMDTNATPATTYSSSSVTPMQQPVFDADEASDDTSSSGESASNDCTQEDAPSSSEAVVPVDSDRASSGDTVTSSSDSSSNGASSLSELGADSEVELPKSDQDTDESMSSDGGSQGPKEGAGEDMVSTSDSKRDSREADTKLAQISGQGDRSSLPADDIVERRESGGFETSCVSSAAECHPEDSDEPMAKRPRLSDSNDIDLPADTSACLARDRALTDSTDTRTVVDSSDPDANVSATDCGDTSIQSQVISGEASQPDDTEAEMQCDEGVTQSHLSEPSSTLDQSDSQEAATSSSAAEASSSLSQEPSSSSSSSSHNQDDSQ